MLRFDVETISKATSVRNMKSAYMLRFDVETISKATVTLHLTVTKSCGLM